MNPKHRPLLLRTRRGFTLVMTLTILAAVTILVVGLFSIASSEKQVSSSFDAVEQADLAVQAGLAKASHLLNNVTRGDDEVIFSKPLDPPTDTAGRAREHLMAARYHATDSKWEYTPLLSGSQAPTATASLVMDINGDGNADVPQPLEALTVEEAESLTNFPRTLPWKSRPLAYWEYLTMPSETDGSEQQAARY